ncbi:MAG: DegT/DnrJ/EryC1/StrS family aminotransferase [Candidatus Promineifilaceae bacterium]|jgi:perosamine synthetase
MNTKQQRMRQLPPSAVPVTLTILGKGLRASPEAHDEFRTAVAAYHDLPPEACFLASSGRTVLYTLLKGLAADRESRKQVVIPAYTCPVVSKVALDLSLQPVYVDITPETACFVQDQLEKAVTEQTLAVFLVHPFGIPLPITDVAAAAENAGAAVIEDAAQAMGARWNGRPVGLAGDFGLFSLGPGKPLSTGGGGIIIAGREQNQEALARWWADLPPASGFISAQAWARQAAFRLAFHPRSWWVATRVGLQRMGNQEASWGYSVRDLSDTQAAIGAALLPRLDEINMRRREVASQLAKAVGQSSAVQMLKPDAQAEPIYLRLPLLAESESVRERLFERMWSAGIGVGRMYEKTLPEIFTSDNQAGYPGAQAFAHRLLTLPTHYQVSENDLQIMEEILADF